jgi:hypothetical protein
VFTALNYTFSQIINYLGDIIMDFEKLKPWNWFKHEESSDSLIPASRSEISVNNASPLLDKKPVYGDPFNSLCYYSKR